MLLVLCSSDQVLSFLPTHWSCPASTPILSRASTLLPALSPFLWASAMLHGPGSVQGSMYCSGQSLFTSLPRAHTLLPSLGMSSCPRGVPEVPPHPRALFFTCLGHLSLSVMATPRQWFPEARVTLTSHLLCIPRLGTGCGKPGEVCRNNGTISWTTSFITALPCLPAPHSD